MVKTYLDSSVLIELAHDRSRALVLEIISLLDDPAREWHSSFWVQFETLPKPIYHKRHAEVALYEAFFTRAHVTPCLSRQAQDHAMKLAVRHGLSGGDALHVALALESGVDEIIVNERPESPFCRVTELRVLSLHSLVKG